MDAGKNRLAFVGCDRQSPQLGAGAGRLVHGQVVEKLVVVGEEGRGEVIDNGAFRRQGALATVIVHPDGALPHTHAGDDRVSIFLDDESLFIRGAKGNLLRLARGKALPPKVALPFDPGGEIHPLAIG